MNWFKERPIQFLRDGRLSFALFTDGWMIDSCKLFDGQRTDTQDEGRLAAAARIDATIYIWERIDGEILSPSDGLNGNEERENAIISFRLICVLQLPTFDDETKNKWFAVFLEQRQTGCTFLSGLWRNWSQKQKPDEKRAIDARARTSTVTANDNYSPRYFFSHSMNFRPKNKWARRKRTNKFEWKRGRNGKKNRD